MARKQKTADKKGEDALVKTLRSLFKKEYPELVPFARGGVRLFNYIFDATRAAEKVGVPKGFKLKPVEVETSTIRGKQEAKVVEIIVALLEGAFGRPATYARVGTVALQNAAPPTSVVYDKVKAILIDQLGIDPTEIVPTAKFVEDLGADSLDTVELTMELETAFNIEIPDEDAERLITVQDVVDYLEKDLKNFDLVDATPHQCTSIV